MLVRMKALMALVTFWILRSLLGPLVCLMGNRQMRYNINGNWTILPFKCLHPTFTNLFNINGSSYGHDDVQ